MNINKTNKLLKKLQSGKLSAKERITLSLAAKNDAFLSEAMEGFELSNSYSENSNNKTKLSLKLILINSFALIILITGWIVYFNPFQLNKPNVSVSNAIKNSNPNENRKQKNENPLTNNSLTEKTKKISNEQNLLSDPLKNKTEYKKTNQLYELPIINQVQLNTTHKQNIQRPVGFNCAFKKIKNHLVVDYLKTSRYKSRQPVDLNEEIDKNDLTPTVHIDIEKLLEEGVHHYQQKNYKKAIVAFTTIAEYFPNDLNAQYYLGLCYYQTGFTKKSKNYFESAFENEFDLFRQESAYYLAICYLNEDRKEDALEVLTKASHQSGLYTDLLLQTISKIKQ